MKNILIVINDAPYKTEKAYNALRLANELSRTQKPTNVTIFLMADAVYCAEKDQITKDGEYNIGRMLRYSYMKNATVKYCGSCIDSRGLKRDQMMEGVDRSTMVEFAALVVTNDNIINF